MSTPLLTADQLEAFKRYNTPTIANAIEPFKVRDRTEGFIGGEVCALFPEMPPMVGAALTVTMTNGPGATAGRENYWRMYEALSRMPAPSVLVVQDISGAPSRCGCGAARCHRARPASVRSPDARLDRGR